MFTADRLDLLKLFVRIVETGQMSEAAGSLGLSQPSASRCLKRLETILDTRLVERSSRGLSLTPSGHAFLPQARRLLAEWDGALEAARADRQTLSGAIRIAAPIAIGQSILASIAARFVRSHPEFRIDRTLRDDPIDPAAEGYDLWIRAGDVRRDDLVIHAIYRVRRAIVVTPALGVVEHPRDLAGRKAVRLSTFVPSQIEMTGEAGTFVLDQTAAFVTDNIFAAQAAILEGIGYAVLPLWLVQADLARRALVRTCPAWSPPEVTLSLAHPPNPRQVARVNVFADYVRAELTRQEGLGIAFLDAIGAGGTIVSA